MDKISPIKERILQFIEYKQITKVEFCSKTKISYANMKGKSLESEFGGTQLCEILTYYGEISPDWLILGKGEMIRTNSKAPIESTFESKSCKLCYEKDQTIDALKSTISTQKEYIASQNAQIQDLRKLLKL